MYYIIVNQNGTWVTYGDEDFDTYEDAKYQLECLQEADENNGENNEYKICEIKEVERVSKEKEYAVIITKVGKEEEIFSTNNEIVAVSKARKAHAQSAQWEDVKIIHKTDNEVIPYRVFVADREAGNVIEEIKGQELLEAIDKAIGVINDFEAEDKASDNYTPDFYDIINENGESYIY